MKSFFSSTTARFLVAAAVLSTSACSHDDTVGETREALRSSVRVPNTWRNQPGTTAIPVMAALAAPSDEEREAQQKALFSSAKRDRLLLETWTREFNDPALAQIVAAALYANPDLRSMLARVSEARARRGLARAELWPTINGYLSGKENYRRDHTSYTTTGDFDQSRKGHTTTSSDSYSAGFAATWEVDLFGKYQAAADAATAEIAESEENYRGAQLALVTEIAETYVLLRQSEIRHAVAKSSIETHRETARIAKWREEAGTGDTFESQQAANTLGQAEAGLPPIDKEIADARTRLAILTGKTPGALDVALATRAVANVPANASAADRVLAHLPAAPGKVKYDVPHFVLKRRPDIQAADRAALAAALRTKSSERAWFPTLNLSGSIGIEALKTGNLFNPEATVGSILAGFTQPIFDGWRISQNIDIANEVQKQAMLNYESAVINALGEVESAFVAESAAAARLESLKKSTNLADDNARIAEQKYASGLTDFSEVLEIQRVKLGLEEQVVTSAAEHTTTRIRLFKALGGALVQNEPEQR